QIRIAAHDAAISPDGRAIALLGQRDLTIAQLPPRAPAPRRLFSGESLGQVAWSPDGGWLLVSWPAANQWIFVRAGARPRIEAVSRIAQQFGGAPISIDGWCCA